MKADYQQHPLSAAFPAMNGRSWRGVHWAPRVVADIVPSAKHPGYYHYRVANLRDKSEALSIHPVQSDAIEEFVCHEIAECGIDLSAVSWVESSHSATDWDLSPKRKRRESVIYFVRGGQFVKIGTTCGDGLYRLAEIQTGCPYELETLAIIDGGFPEERALHRKFGHLRARNSGEWFRLEGALVDYIAGIK